MSKRHIIIPFYPLDVTSGRPSHELSACITALAGAGYSRIIVCCGLNTSLSVPSPAKVHYVDPCEAPDSPLPHGWLAALAATPAGHDVAIIDYSSNYSVGDVRKAFESLKSSQSEIALGVFHSKDHPCQLSQFLNVITSRIFIPIDDDPTCAAALCSKFARIEGNVSVSRPFQFDWSPWILTSQTGAKSYEFVESLQTLMTASPEKQCTCYLWKESDGEARLFVPEQRKLAALAIFPGSQVSPIEIRQSQKGLLVEAPGDVVQLFPLDGKLNEFNDEFMRLHPLIAQQDGRNIAIIPNRFDKPFIAISYANQTSPACDIELPYVPQIPSWSISNLSMVRRRKNNGVIFGRQAFPPVLEFDGTIAAFSNSARANPMEVLEKQGFAYFMVRPKDDATVERPVASESGNVKEPYLDELFRRHRVPRKDELVPETDGLSKHGDRLAELVMFCFEKDAFTFRDALEKHIISQAGVDDKLRPIRAHAIVRRREEDGITKNLQAVHLFPQLLDDDGREKEQQNLTLLASAVKQARQTSLPLGWLNNGEILDENDAGHGLTMHALDFLYDAFPGLGNYYAHSATKFITKGRYDVALNLFDREQARGGMTAGLMLQYANMLAVGGRIREAEQTVEQAYLANGSLLNGYADMGWWAWYWTDYQPEKALKCIEKDMILGRLGKNYVSRHATILTCNGLFETSMVLVAKSYENGETVPDGGYSRPAWEHWMVQRQNPEAILKYFDRDERHGNTSFQAYHMIALAATGRMEDAFDLARPLYEGNSNACGYYAGMALVHWLVHRDDDILRDLLHRDLHKGEMVFFLKILYVLLVESHDWKEFEIKELMKQEVRQYFNVGWKRCIQSLRIMGFARQDIAELIPELSEALSGKKKTPCWPFPVATFISKLDSTQDS